MIKPALFSSTSVASSNACKLCAPLGASLVFKGIAGAVPLLHGSQGCSTYIRRYLIGHFREPVDIASSGFSEMTTIFGGGANLAVAISNIVEQYHPELIGIASTCLAETIGEDVGMHLRTLDNIDKLPAIVHVSCPSYAGSHTDGFRNAVKALIDKFAESLIQTNAVTLFPGMLSCAELRHVRSICSDFGITPIMIPDYSETLDGGIWDSYCHIPPGGTTIDELIASGSSIASIEFGSSCTDETSAGTALNKKCHVVSHKTAIPIGIRSTDAFFEMLSSITGKPVPETHLLSRQRLIDTYIDGHKFLAGKKAAIYGDEDYLIALAGFLAETGISISTIICGSPGRNFRSSITSIVPDVSNTVILDDADFEDLSQCISNEKPDIIIGSSKGYGIAHSSGIPLIRTGFPIHDRIGGQHIMHAGYEGTRILFESIVNTIIEHSQAGSNVGYMAW